MAENNNADVKKLKVGSVMLLTNIGAGRVTQLDDVDGDVAVSYGPAKLTDVIADGDLQQRR